MHGEGIAVATFVMKRSNLHVIKRKVNIGFPARVSNVQRVWSNNLIRARRNAATNSPQDLPRANLVFVQVKMQSGSRRTDSLSSWNVVYEEPVYAARATDRTRRKRDERAKRPIVGGARVRKRGDDCAVGWERVRRKRRAKGRPRGVAVSSGRA